jgi:hypothetical protein
MKTTFCPSFFNLLILYTWKPARGNLLLFVDKSVSNVATQRLVSISVGGPVKRLLPIRGPCKILNSRMIFAATAIRSLLLANLPIAKWSPTPPPSPLPPTPPPSHSHPLLLHPLSCRALFDWGLQFIFIPTFLHQRTKEFWQN